MYLKNRQKYIDALRRGADWLTSKLKEDGSYGPEIDDLACYYKGPWALLVSGHYQEALKMLNWIAEKFMQEDGDFRGEDRKSEVSFLDKEYYTYANTWIVTSAQKIGRFDISYKGMNFILRFRDPRSGGFYSERAREEQGSRIDILSTSFCGQACLYFGMLEEARRAGDFLIEVQKMQPDPQNRLFTSYLPEKGLVTDFPEDQSLHYVVDAGSSKQWYFFIGYPAGYLTKLYLATKDGHYLSAAEGYFRFASLCADDVYAYPPSGKLGWGSAVQFMATGREEYLRVAEKIADYLVSIQLPNGCWLYEGLYSGIDVQPPSTTFDITGEFVIWLSEILQETSVSSTRPLHT